MYTILFLQICRYACLPCGDACNAYLGCGVNVSRSSYALAPMVDLYLVPTPCERARPSGSDSLVDLYGLRDFANSVARQDPETGAKRKLRKSYKNHVADLPGKHPVPGPGESDWQLIDTAMRPPPNSSADVLKTLDFDADSLSKLRFQRGSGPLPGFDLKLLAAPGAVPNKNGDPSSPGSPGANSPGEEKKRKRRDGLPAEKKRKF